MTTSTKHEFGHCSNCIGNCERYDDDAWHHLGKPCSGFAFATFIPQPVLDFTKAIVLDAEQTKGA
jgi:hypothetical protein